MEDHLSIARSPLQRYEQRSGVDGEDRRSATRSEGVSNAWASQYDSYRDSCPRVHRTRSVGLPVSTEASTEQPWRTYQVRRNDEQRGGGATGQVMRSPAFSVRNSARDITLHGCEEAKSLDPQLQPDRFDGPSMRSVDIEGSSSHLNEPLLDGYQSAGVISRQGTKTEAHKEGVRSPRDDGNHIEAGETVGHADPHGMAVQKLGPGNPFARRSRGEVGQGVFRLTSWNETQNQGEHAFSAEGPNVSPLRGYSVGSIISYLRMNACTSSRNVSEGAVNLQLNLPVSLLDSTGTKETSPPHSQTNLRVPHISPLATVPQRARKFRVVEITSGMCHRYDVQTPELLRMVHLHNEKNQLLDRKVGALKLRDLRQVVNPYGDGRPSIELRRNCVLVNMPTIRCILLYQCVLVLPPNWSTAVARGSGAWAAYAHDSGVSVGTPKTHAFASFRGHHSSSDVMSEELQDGLSHSEKGHEQYELLISKLVHLSELKRSGPLEFAVIEAILVHVCDDLVSELAPITTAAEHLLQIIHEQPSSSKKLRQISDLKRRLCAIKEKSRGVERAIRELLNTEEDMRRLELSVFWGHDDDWDDPPKTANAEDAEILLECYEQEIEAILQVILRTDEALDDALQLMELHLASVRNAFLKSEIALDILGVMFGAIAAVAGVFGMNIKNGWEDRNDIFNFWSLGFALACGATIAAVYMWFRRQKL